MKQRRTKGRENSRELCVPPPLLGERAGVRASVFSNLIFGVVGSNSSGKTRSFRADYSGDEIAGLGALASRRRDAGAPSSRGKHARLPGVLAPLVWHCLMGTHVGCCFISGLLTLETAVYCRKRSHRQAGRKNKPAHPRGSKPQSDRRRTLSVER